MVTSHNFFSLQSLRKLYHQLHNKPEGGLFGTVGEAVKHRDLLISQEDAAAAAHWAQDRERTLHIQSLRSRDDMDVEEAVRRWERHQDDACAFWHVVSGKRLADIRAIQTFLERCGLSL